MLQTAYLHYHKEITDKEQRPCKCRCEKPTPDELRAHERKNNTKEKKNRRPVRKCYNRDCAAFKNNEACHPECDAGEYCDNQEARREEKRKNRENKKKKKTSLATGTKRNTSNRPFTARRLEVEMIGKPVIMAQSM